VTRRLPTAARIARDAQGLPYAPDYGDVYHARIGAEAQARGVFMAGNQLPARWAGRDDFTLLETGFGLGHNFMTTAASWRGDAARGARLHYVAVELHPPRLQDLAQAHEAATGAAARLRDELLACWPPVVAGWHALDLDCGRVRLLLGLGDGLDLLSGVVLNADAVYLDGFAPDRNPELWSPRLWAVLARRLRPGATLASWCVARAVQDGLRAQGFELERLPGIGGKRHRLAGRWAPRWPVRDAQSAPGSQATANPATGREAVVVGGGLAGAGTAQALAGLGWAVTVLDAQPTPASQASGNRAGLFHGTLHRDDSLHARWFRAAALLAGREIGRAIAAGAVEGRVCGLLRGDAGAQAPAMQALIDAQRLDAAYVQALDATQASGRAGITLAHPAWWYPGGGWVAPATLVRHWLAQPGIRFVGNAQVARLRRDGGQWSCLDAQGQRLVTATVVVLANAGDAGRLGALVDWPVRADRGQVSGWSGAAAGPHGLLCPLIGQGYVIPLPDGGLLCGATPADAQGDDLLPGHQRNFARLGAQTGITAVPDPARWKGRMGWRHHSADRLPMVGAVPADEHAAREDQCRLVPRLAGLHLAAAFGGRGISLVPLCTRLLAAQISGTPWPVERDLADAVDPARWRVRRARHARR